MCKYNYYLTLWQFYHSKKYSMLISSHFLFLLPLSPCQLLSYFLHLWINLFSAFYIWESYNGMESHKWNHTIYGLLCLASSTKHDVFIAHPFGVYVHTSFVFVTKSHTVVWIYHILLIHLSIDGHWVVPTFWFAWTYVFNYLVYIARGKTARLYSNSVSNQLRKYQTILERFYILHSHQQCLRATISLHPPQYFLLPVLLNYRHLIRCGVASHCGFHLHFCNDWWCWAFFDVLVSHLYTFRELCIEILCSFLNYLSFYYWAIIVLYEAWVPVPYYMYNLQIVSISKLSFYFLINVMT